MTTSRATWGLVAMAVLQVLCATWALRLPGFASIDSILFFGSGLVSSFLLLWAPPVKPLKLTGTTSSPGFLLLKLPLFLLFVAAGIFYVRSIVKATPLSIESADMLPIIKTMGQRFLNGAWAEVYSPIPQIWNGVQPIYPPALWISFLPAVHYHFDLRWITAAGIYAAAFLCLLSTPFLPKQWSAAFLLTAALVLLLYWLHTDAANNLIRLTEEGVVIFYYCLLVLAIASGNGFFIGAAAALCLLSRFALAGWLPCALICCLVYRQYFFLLKATLAGAAVVTLLLLIPFGWKPVWLFMTLPGKYIAHAQNVWDTYPAHFTQSLGMAKFFGREEAVLLHRLLVTGSFAAPVLFTVYALLRKRYNLTNVLLASLQLTLTVFYNFIDVSYLYLFYTPVFVTLLLAGVCLTAQQVVENRRISSR